MNPSFPRCRLNREFWPLAAFLISLSAAIPSLPIQLPPDGACYIYPSPVTSPSAWAVYDMPQSGSVEVRVYNEAGDLVLDVTDAQPAGVVETGMNLSDLRNGVYICRVLLTPHGGTTRALKLFVFSVAR